MVEAAATSTTEQYPFDSESVVLREDCALTDPDVGRIPIPAGPGLAIAHILLQKFLLQKFPCILNIKYYKYVDRGWKAIAVTIDEIRRIGTFVHSTGEAHATRIYVMIPADVHLGHAFNVGDPRGGGQG